jgi:hypothetical protein
MDEDLSDFYVSFYFFGFSPFITIYIYIYIYYQG